MPNYYLEHPYFYNGSLQNKAYANTQKQNALTFLGYYCPYFKFKEMFNQNKE